MVGCVYTFKSNWQLTVDNGQSKAMDNWQAKEVENGELRIERWGCFSSLCLEKLTIKF